jgi:hypothetical protein
MAQRIMLGLLVVMTSVAHAWAKPVLVAVDLADRPEIRRWLALNHPTYEYIEGTAIAELDDSQVPNLFRLGFTHRIIDESPWSEPYFVGSVPQDLKVEVPGAVVWQKGALRLIKVAPGHVPALARLPVRFQPLRRTELRPRFWQRVLTKYVPSKRVGWDPLIQSIVDEVNTDSLTAYTQRLQDFESRLVLGDSSYAASAWVAEKMAEWGYACEFDSFYSEGCQFFEWWPGAGYERNVVATREGYLDPSRIFVIGGHFDSIVWSDTALTRIWAPGADDNATGTAATLEAARVMRAHSWDATIQYVAWSAEEVGLRGSYHQAYQADALGLNLAGVLNYDMIGYMNNAQLDGVVYVRDTFSDWLAGLFIQAAATYAAPLSITRVATSGGSDWYPFATYGFFAIGGAEGPAAQNPYWHTAGDVMETLSPELYTAFAKAGVATIAMLASCPGEVRDVAVRDVGDGDGLVLVWSPNTEADVVGYTVYWGPASETYTDSHFVAGAEATSDSLTGFTADSTYYFVVRAMDDDGHESYLAAETEGVARVVPVAPVDVAATPIPSGIRVHWPASPELDVAGYRVYRRTNDGASYDTLNQTPLVDTTFADSPLDGANSYYYAVQAIDLSDNESMLSDEAYGRPITLDQGILLVDETRNYQNLPDSLQDAFYDYVMAGSQFIEFEYGALDERPILADMGPYSTVVWHADDYAEFMAWQSLDALLDYLDAGGNLWFMGWQPTASLAGAAQYPFSFGPGDAFYDYANVSEVGVSSMSDSLQAAVGMLGYPRLDVDPDKVPVPAWGGTMRYVEALTAAAPTECIYSIDLVNDGSPFEGETCGIRYDGQDYKLVFLGFPLYYMNREQARLLAHKVLNDFGEPVGVTDDPGRTLFPTRVALHQNVPNPFSDQTTISYGLPEPGRVTLRVYNLTGQLVSTLVDARQDAGLFKVIWEGTDQGGAPVGAGTYFYKLQAGAGTATKRLAIVR